MTSAMLRLMLLSTLVLWTTHALVVIMPTQPTQHIVRRRAGNTQLQIIPEGEKKPEIDMAMVDPDDFEYQDSERDPPPYPEGLHDAAKADRHGPFWSTLGEPDSSTGTRPGYLRRDDWHISSTYTAGERESYAAEEEEFIAAANALTIEMPEADEEDEDPFREREYIKFEPKLASGATKSEIKMPQTWQEYQFLQEQIASFAAEESLSEADRKEALRHEETLADFYVEFKVIIAEGWELMNNQSVEAAARYLLTMRKKVKVRV
mmetsp:Transcript_20646/g.52568  ORF Transcript_20646/g.52568 Transcript_20646/m.52568 type:complete len:263 (+) Transcript_20646:40-828(+)